jgi:integrase
MTCGAPLRHILGFATVLHEDAVPPLDAKLEQHLSGITESATRMSTLIDDLLHFARCSQVELNRESVDLNAIVEAVIRDHGWRSGELLDLRVRNINLAANPLRLDPGTTKHLEGRLVVMTRAVRELVTASIYGKKPNDYVFTRKDGQPVKAFRGTWRSACCRAGLGKMLCPECGGEVTNKKRHRGICARSWKRAPLRYDGLFHDLRRAAVRNLVRAGVPEKVAMLISGHKNRNVFERYNISNDRDVRQRR